MSMEIRSPYNKGTKAYEIVSKIVNEFPDNYSLYTLYRVGNKWYWLTNKGYLHILRERLEVTVNDNRLYKIEDCYLSKTNIIINKGCLVSGLYYKYAILNRLKQGISLENFIYRFNQEELLCTNMVCV